MTRSCLTRRQLLGQSVSSLLALGLWPGVLDAGDNGNDGDFHFVVANDVHYVDRFCGRWFAKVLRQMQSHTPAIDFTIIAGDLTEHGKENQLAAMRDLLKASDHPVHSVIGNHDYLTQTDRRAYEKLFPRQLNYWFEHRGWQFIGIDTTEGQLSKDTNIQKATFKWLDETLPKLDRKRSTVLFTHFPLGSLVPGRPRNADLVLERFKPFNLKAVFSGHFHALTERAHGACMLTTNRCCSYKRQNHVGTKAKGYFLCLARDGVVSRTFIETKVS